MRFVCDIGQSQSCMDYYTHIVGVLILLFIAYSIIYVGLHAISYLHKFYKTRKKGKLK